MESQPKFLLCWGPERAFKVAQVWSGLAVSISKADDPCLEAGPVLDFVLARDWVQRGLGLGLGVRDLAS